MSNFSPLPPGASGSTSTSTDPFAMGMPSPGMVSSGTVPGGTTSVGTPLDPLMPTATPSTGAPPTTPGTVEAVAPSSRAPLVPRISKREYANSILDVFGVELTSDELDPAAGGILDDAGDGVFKHFADKQTSTEQQTLAYFNVGQSAAARISDSALDALGTCSDATDACAGPFISAVGERLFRRPLDEREQGTYGTLFSTVVTDGADYYEAARAVVHAMLQAPPFLFRVEDELSGTVGIDRKLSSYELAARLAAFVWVSVPDAELLDAAAAGTLTDDAVLTAQVQRMLQDPKAQRFTETFIDQFSRARLAAFDGVTPEQANALHESIVASFQHHFWEAERSVADLFTTTEFVVNAPVAELLELDMPGPGLQVVDVSGLPERVGLLTHPGMIAGMGDRDVGSFVNRGKYLLERLLCKNPGAFPAAVQTELDEFNRNTEGFNEHEKMAVRKTRPECWGCHMQFEPLALGFSRFDGAGRYVGDVDAAGKSLSLEGWVPTSIEEESPHYTNVAEYMQILVENPIVQQCMTEHFLEFATAHSTDATTKTNAEAVGKHYVDGGSTLSAMVLSVVQSPLFSSLQTTTATAPAAEGGI